MARKKINTDELMKSFMSPVQNESVTTQEETQQYVTGNQKKENKATADPVPKKIETLEKPERTKPITFCMPESVNARMMKYIFTKKLAGEKITATQMLNEAIIKYMDELGIE